MRKTMVIPTYWCRRTGEAWREGDAVYDHPTPVDQEGTLERTLVSMKQFREKDFKLVILVCPTTEDVEEAALAQVRRIVLRSGLGAETYLFTAGDLREIAGILRGAGLDVLSVEPPRADNPLLTAKNCCITPHIAWAARDARARLIQVVVENVQGFLQGRVQNNVAASR